MKFPLGVYKATAEYLNLPVTEEMEVGVVHLVIKGKSVYLKLHEFSDHVMVEATDARGKRLNGGDLIGFRSDGTLLRCAGVSKLLPFQFQCSGIGRILAR